MIRSWTFWRLFGTFGLLWLASFGLLGFAVITQVDRYERDLIATSLRARALLAQDALRGHTDDSAALPERVQRLADDAGARLTLIDADGRVRADSARDPAAMGDHSDRPEVIQARDRGTGVDTRISQTLGRPMLYVAVRAEDLAPDVAFVRAALPLDKVEEQVVGLHRIIWTAAAGAGLAALTLSFWLARRTVRPLAELTEAARLIAEGGYGHKVYAFGPDEIRELARTFNHMSARLAKQFAQLEEDRQQLRAILSGMVEGVIALGADERILFVNERAARLLEFQPQAAVGRRLWEVVRVRQLQDLARRALANPEPHQEELRWNSPALRSLTVHAARLASAGGAVLVLHDTTDLRRLERMRQDFVANVSHELKTPLSVIKACVETLLDGAVEDPDHRGRFLERISDQSDRLHALILDLLSLARIESGEEAFEWRAVPLGPAVADCLERHLARAAVKRQRLVAEPPPDGDGLAAHVDEEALGQILDNLIENAIKYTPEESRIIVRWRAERGQVRLEVEDNGQGIPEADLPRIFERFYRVDKARSREMGGTGLGLAIVKHLAQAMKGSVRATSRVGQGTTFIVSLPQATEAESRAP
jgi:two-component system, OmpR family, phosphate regulon sensor histidine kinase PhoR